MSGVANLGTLYASLGLDGTAFMSSMAQAQAAMQAADVKMKATAASMTKSFSAAAASMKVTGRKMTTFLTLPLAAVSGAAFKTQMDFEASLSKITGLVGVAADQVAEWKQEILDMAPAVRKGPKELADALFFVTSAGIRGKEAMEVLEMSAKAASAGLGETKVVADLVTSAMNAYGTANLSASQATDILVSAVREGKAEADQLAASMGMVLPIASAMGVSFDQVGAAQAAMTRTGTTAATSATQLKSILNGLLKPSLDADKALGKMGTSAAQLRKTIREDGLITALGDIKGLTAEYGEEMMAKVFPNIRALSGVLDLMGANAEENIAIFEALKKSQGALGKAFKASSQTDLAEWKTMMVSLQVGLIEFGGEVRKSIIPILQSLSGFIQKITAAFKEMDDAQRENIMRIIAWSAAAGPVLLIMGGMLKAIPKLILGVVGIGNAMAALTKLLLLNPYTALAVGVGILVVALIKLRKGMQDNSDTITLMEKVNASALDMYASQAGKVKALIKIIENENLSNKKRKEAIEELKKIMPDYNGHLTNEGTLIDSNTQSIEDYLVALKEKIKIQVYEDEYVKALTAQITIQDKLTEATDDATLALENYREGVAAGIPQGGRKWMKLWKEMGNANALKAGLEEALKETDDFVNEVQYKMENLELGPKVPPPDDDDDERKRGAPKGLDLTGFNIMKELFPNDEFAEGKRMWDDFFKDINDDINDMPAVLPEIGLSKIDLQPLIDMKKHLADVRLETDLLSAAQSYLSDIFSNVGSAVGTSNNKLSEWIQYSGKVITSIIDLITVTKTLIAAKKASAVAGAIEKGAEYPFPLNLLAIGASVAGVLASFAAIPQLAAGGIAYGDTIARVGEYSGASSNPEVIAPLDKLKTLIGGTGGTYSGPLEFRIDGYTLVAMLDKMNSRNGIT